MVLYNASVGYLKFWNQALYVEYKYTFESQ